MKLIRSRTERIELRTQPEAKALLERAAQLRRLSLSAYLLETGLRRAAAEVRESETLYLHEVDRTLVFATMADPPQPNEALAALWCEMLAVPVTLVALPKDLSCRPFDCGVPELNTFLRRDAFENGQRNVGFTFAAVTKAHEVAGYFTVTNASISAEVLPIAALRVGKLAVDKRFQKQGLGRWLLRQAVVMALQKADDEGLTAMLVDVTDASVQGFYRNYGFLPFQEHPLTMLLPMATLRHLKHSC